MSGMVTPEQWNPSQHSADSCQLQLEEYRLTEYWGPALYLHMLQSLTENDRLVNRSIKRIYLLIRAKCPY